MINIDKVCTNHLCWVLEKGCLKAGNIHKVSPFRIVEDEQVANDLRWFHEGRITGIVLQQEWRKRGVCD